MTERARNAAGVDRAEAVMLASGDNVAVVLSDAHPGTLVFLQGRGDDGPIEAVAPIPRFHKIALCPVGKGEKMIRKGCAIGVAREDIRAGDHVHTHNLRSLRK